MQAHTIQTINHLAVILQNCCYQIGFIMNLVDCIVTEVREVFFHGYWCVRVGFNSYGVESETVLTFKTKDEAKKVKTGYVFLA